MNHDAAPAPPHRGLLIKSVGLLVAVSPLCAWPLRDILPSAALLAPLFLASVFAGTAWAMKKNIHETFLPVLPAVRVTLAAGIAFTAVIIPLGHLNLLVILCSFLLLTLAASYACLLCIGKKSPTGC